MTCYRVEIVTPAAPRGAHTGNATTARRWGRLLTDLGHDVRVTQAWSGEPVDALVALHAHKSAASVQRFAAVHPDRPLVLALTGTDVYRDLDTAPEAQQALRCAHALVVLQQRALQRLPGDVADRAQVIHQSVSPPPDPPAPRQDVFEVAVVAHLRPVKDPFLAADAARRLPADSRIEIVHCGAALDDEIDARARREAATNPRWRWLGGQAREATLRLVARARVLAITSRLEGGANVVSEALAVGTPVIATDIDGSVGLLGDDYPGYVPVGDAEALADALRRVEQQPALHAALGDRVRALGGQVDPAAERRAWDRLLAKLT